MACLLLSVLFVSFHLLVFSSYFFLFLCLLSVVSVCLCFFFLPSGRSCVVGRELLFSSFWSLMDLESSVPRLDLKEDIPNLSINDKKTTSFNELTLIGQVISGKIVNFKAIKAILLNVWDFGSKVQVSFLDRNKFAVCFNNHRDLDRVVSACSWAIKRHITILQR